jgi:hypothetical protein
LEEARRNPDLDLRAHVSPALELKIRQAYHRLGLLERARVTALFSKEEAFAVALVGARMLLEMQGGREGSRR